MVQQFQAALEQSSKTATGLCVPDEVVARFGAGKRPAVAADDEVTVELVLDTAPREVSVPADLQDALAADAEASQLFAGLSYSNTRRLVLANEGAKTTGTRQRRVARTISQLHEGRV